MKDTYLDNIFNLLSRIIAIYRNEDKTIYTKTKQLIS